MVFRLSAVSSDTPPEYPDENSVDVVNPEKPDETTVGADQTEKLPDATEEALYKAEDLRFLVQTEEEFGEFDLTDGIEYDEEHYDLSVIFPNKKNRRRAGH